ncbi:MAG: hypothetical protein L0312_22035 [Acidobacteria bacterium]|nr:hypothetical protein [Acidobacteriota bacterium]
MKYWLGIFMIVTGVPNLLLNEFSVNFRRSFKSWWRDDQDAERNQQLKELHRVSVYLGSIVWIEIGVCLTGEGFIRWPGRTLLYAALGLWLLWRRPALRSGAWWSKLLATNEKDTGAI